MPSVYDDGMRQSYCPLRPTLEHAPATGFYGSFRGRRELARSQTPVEVPPRLVPGAQGASRGSLRPAPEVHGVSQKARPRSWDLHPERVTEALRDRGRLAASHGLLRPS